MTGVPFVALAALVGVGSAALAWRQSWRAAAPTGGDPAALALALKRLPAGQRLGELLHRAEPGSWEHDLAVELAAAPGEADRVAVVNLALSEVEHALSRGADWPKAALRIALLGEVLLAITACLADWGQIKWSLGIAAIGAVAALACFEAGRSSARNAVWQRRAIDDLIAAALGDAPRPADVASRRTVPERRHTPSASRWRRRRRDAAP